MGISGLTKILKENLKNREAIQEIDLSKYRGQKLAVDINIYLHGFAYNPTQKKPNSHIDGFFQMACDLLKNGIVPVMILDGKPPEAKSGTAKSRSESKQELQEKSNNLSKEIDSLLDQLEKLESLKISMTRAQIDTTLEGNSTIEANSTNTLVDISKKTDELVKSISDKQTEMEKYLKRDIKIQSTMYLDLKILFEYMGVPCLKAKGEADALCVRLYQEGLVGGVLSEDMDILPFGGRLIRGIKEKRVATLTEYNIDKILEGIGFTQAQLVDLCILFGCDYATKIRNIGPKTAFDLICKYKNIEDILDKYIKPELEKPVKPGKKPKFFTDNVMEFKQVYIEARRLLLESPKSEDILDIEKQLILGSLNQNQLLPFLIEKCRYRPATLDKKMVEIGPSYGLTIQPKFIKGSDKTKSKPKVQPQKKNNPFQSKNKKDATGKTIPEKKIVYKNQLLDKLFKKDPDETEKVESYQPIKKTIKMIPKISKKIMDE